MDALSQERYEWIHVQGPYLFWRCSIEGVEVFLVSLPPISRDRHGMPIFISIQRNCAQSSMCVCSDVDVVSKPEFR